MTKIQPEHSPTGRTKRQRNHTVPRMLLNRFAARSVSDEHYVWQFRLGTIPFETNTRNASAITEFYGNPSNGLETALSAMETRQSNILTEILAGADPNAVQDDLRSLLWSLTIRTANLRSNLRDLLAKGIDQMAAQADSDTIKRWLPDRIDEEFDASLDGLIEKLPPVQARALKVSLMWRPALRSKLRLWVRMHLDHTDIAEGIQALLGHLCEHLDFETISSDSHVHSLERLPAINHVPDAFRPDHWSVVRSDSHTVVIGDGACFASNATQETGHLMRFAKDWTAIYLPISHDAVLVASRSAHTALRSIGDINRASAALSYDQFFAARNTERERSLQTLIRTGTATLTLEEMQQIVREVWSCE